MATDRRRFLTGTLGAALLAPLAADLFAEPAVAPAATNWDSGQVRHLLPTVNHSSILIKASFVRPLASAPRLRVGSRTATGVMSDTAGEFWQFHVTGLQPARRYTLSLAGSNGAALCQPWELSTFPAPDARPARLRVLFFTCAGGHEGLSFLPTAIRSRLLRRALALQPDAAVANGDHVYWDLRSNGSPGESAEGTQLAGRFSRSALVFGSTNETVLKRAATPQIVPVYGTDFRSTPMFFLQDDHDYFENDEASDDLITFPPSPFMLRLARAGQRMFYPEFLPDETRPAGLPFSSQDDREAGVSERFGTLRFGRLAEILLYDARRTLTLAGPSAVFVDLEVERWLRDRTAASDAAHVVHAPSTPPGWSAGKWGEWYPDMLGADGKLTTTQAKPVLAGRLAGPTRSPHDRHRPASWDLARRQRRPARDRSREDVAVRNGEFRAHANHERAVGADRHEADRVAIGAPRRGGHPTRSHRPSRGREAGRRARVHDCRLRCGGNRSAPLQVEQKQRAH